MVKEINLDLPELLGKSETVTSPGASVQLPHNATSALVALVIDGKCAQTGTPSPDNPAPITTITGDLTITRANGDLSDTATASLGSVELCSLPDGTKDEYDAVTGIVTKRVGRLDLIGNEVWSYQQPWPPAWSTPRQTIPAVTYYGKMLSTFAPSDKVNTGNNYLNVRTPMTLAEWQAAMSGKQHTIYYPLAEPYTVHLDYSLPPVQGGEEMSVDTSLPTEIVWRYDTVRYLKPRAIELTLPDAVEEIALVLDK